ncbi:MAG: type II toxin-antitoxin system HicA family toxin [Candidatus Liptonbacteria bacterium]|nr:type II toxin-antitoxin system HicA family toxin [Candidatus Liptonbacteria bacterium]
MPRGLYNWTAEDAVRFLKDRGFVHNHTRGSHFYYVGKYGGIFRQVSVPFHGARALKPRTLKGIIAQSGIPKNEWLGK